MTDTSKAPETAYDLIEKDAKELKLNFSKEELALLADQNKYSDKDISRIKELFDYLVKRKREAVAETCLRLSRLPRVNPKTFESFDFNRLHGADVDKLKAMTSLSPLYEHKNIAFIGSQGIGKTHLAMAFGYKCCELGIKTYFLTSSELNDKFTEARQRDGAAGTIASLVKPSCLIIDEIGRCNFDTENTRMFFDVINRRTNKNGPHCLILTSNKTPDTWGAYFEEKDTTLCTLDRIFDDVIVCMMKGESYRGQKAQTLAIEVK